MCAGERLRLAGCSSGRGDCARGGLVCGARRFSRNVLRSVHAGHTFLLGCSAFDYACHAALSGCFSFVLCQSCVPIGRSCVRSRLSLFLRQEKRNGLRNVAFLFRRGSRSPVARSRIVDMVIRLSWFTSGLSVSLRRSRRRTKERGERGRRRGVSAFLRKPLSLAMLSAGSPLGLRAPDCAKESLTPWTLFIWVVMWVRFTRRGALGDNADLTGYGNRGSHSGQGG